VLRNVAPALLTFFFFFNSSRIFNSWHKFLNHPAIQVEKTTTIQITGQENRYLNHHPDHPNHPDHPDHIPWANGSPWGPVGTDGPIEWRHVTTLIMTTVEKLGPGPDQPLPVPRLWYYPTQWTNSTRDFGRPSPPEPPKPEPTLGGYIELVGSIRALIARLSVFHRFSPVLQENHDMTPSARVDTR